MKELTEAIMKTIASCPTCRGKGQCRSEDEFTGDETRRVCELCGGRGTIEVKMTALTQKQKPPEDGQEEDCWLLVMQDMEQRRKDGIAKYGKPVRADNGRKAIVDAYQEQLDNAVYMRQAIEQLNRLETENARLRQLLQQANELLQKHGIGTIENC